MVDMTWIRRYAKVNFVRRYRIICEEYCSQFNDPMLRYVCFTACMDFIKHCTPEHGADYARCIEYALDRLADYINYYTSKMMK